MAAKSTLGRLGLVLLLAGSALCPVSSAFAQAADAPTSAPANDEILVTARRVTENIQSIPLAVSAVGGTALVDRGTRELRDLSATFPNVQINGANAGGSATIISIRGQSTANAGLVFADGAVGLYVDGLNNARSYGMRSGLIDIERVEVLRGPQGTLYGRNTTGGAVSVYTRDPTHELQAMARATYGNYNAWGLEGMLNVPLSNDLALRITGTHSEHDGYGHQVLNKNKPLMDENSTYVRGKLKFESGGLKAVLSGDYFKYLSGGPSMHLMSLKLAPVAGVPGAVATTPANPTGTGTYLVLGGSGTRALAAEAGLPFTKAGLDQAAVLFQSYLRYGPNAAQGIGFYDSFLSKDDANANSQGGSATLNLEYELSPELTVRSISGWRTMSRDESAELDSTPYHIYYADQHIKNYNAYSQELQLLGKMGGMKWVLGGYYNHEKGTDYTNSYPLPYLRISAGLLPNITLTDATSTNINKSVFGQATYSLTDSLSLTGGLRYSSESRGIFNNNHVQSGTVSTCNQPVSLRVDPAVCGINQTATYSDLSWLASVDYKVSPGTLVYIKAARGFRAGGQQGRANGPLPASYVPYAPEVVTEYEAGLKSELLDNRLRLNLAAFWDNYTGVQRSITILVPPGGTTTNTSNAAKARLWGLEGEARLRVTETVSFNLSAGYINPKYITFHDDILGDRSAEAWPTPDFTGAVSATYNTPTRFGSLLATATYSYKGDQNLQPQATLPDSVTQKAYGLLDAALTLHFDDHALDVAVSGRNILGKKYYVAGTSLESLGWNAALTGEPATFALTITKYFGKR